MAHTLGITARKIRRLGCLCLGLIVLASCISAPPTPQISRTPHITIKINGTPVSSLDGTPLPISTPLPEAGSKVSAGRSPLDPPGEVRMGSATVSAPMLDNHGLPAVEVLINGSGPYRFVVDWGANIFAASPELASKLNLPILGVDSMGNQNAQVTSLAIGDAEFRDLTVVLDPFFSQMDEDGVLGRNIYANLLITLDYPAQRIILEQGSLPAPNGQDLLAYQPSEGGAPMLPVEIEGQRFPVVLDTGAARGLILPAAKAAQFSFMVGPIPGGTAIGPQLGAADTQVGRLSEDLHFGAYTISQPLVDILDRSEALLGSGLLRYFSVTLDQENQTLRIRRDQAGPIIIPPAPWETPAPDVAAGGFHSPSLAAD